MSEDKPGWKVTIRYTVNDVVQDPVPIDVLVPDRDVAITTAGGALSVSIDELARKRGLNIGYRVNSVTAEPINRVLS